MNPDEEAAAELQEVRKELEEREDELAAQYMKSMEVYEAKTNAYREAYRRARLSPSGGRGDVTSRGFGDSQALLEEGEPMRPEPILFDAVVEENAIYDRLRHIRETYGLPAPVPVLSEVTPTPAADCPPQEQQRRRDMLKLNMYARICTNGQIVTKTRPHFMDSTFRVDIKEAFALRLAKWPNRISIQIFTSGQMQYPFANSMLVDVKIDVPVRETPRGAMQLAEFTTQGSFAPMWDLHANAQLHYTSGAVRLIASWVPTAEGVPAAPPIPPATLRLMQQQEKKEATNTRTKDWIGAPVDPNDPRNTNVVHLMRRNVVDLRDGLAFSTEPHELLLLDGFYTGRRHELLKHRNDGTIRPCLIPFEESEITEEEFPIVEKETQVTNFVSAATDKFLFLSPTGVLLRDTKLKQALTRLDEDTERGPRVQDIVVLPTVTQTDFGEIVRDLFRPRRPLNPQRKERKIVVTMPEACNLVVQVNRAFNIPLPRVAPAASSKSEEYEDVWKDDESVHTYVEVKFGEEIRRTRIVPGPNPQWNETLAIPISLPNTKNKAQKIPLDNIQLAHFLTKRFFDNLEKDDRDKDSIFQRVERRWLGFVEIAFPTVYYNMKVEGHVPVFAPPLQLSYRQPLDTSGGYLMKAMGVHSSRTTLSLYVTLDPPLSYPLDLPEKLSSVEEKMTLQYANYWVKTVKANKHTENRQITVVVSDLTAKTALIVRYIRPQEPPTTLTTEESLVRYLFFLFYPSLEFDHLKYVSLLPVVPTPIIPGRPPIWATSKQALEMRGGEMVEHAILLCNYLLFLKKEAWVVLGWSIPEGHTAYVMTRAPAPVQNQLPQASLLASFMSLPFFQTAPPPSYNFINPVTGVTYSQHDLLTPLRDIYLILNGTNIWANAQETGEPFRAFFDFTHSSHWIPFFTNRFPLPALPSVQLEQLEYEEWAEPQVADIESQIEASIVHLVEKTRARRFPTRWNRVCNRILREVLQQCENDMLLRGKLNEDAHVQAMDEILASYYSHGFPFQTSFTSLQDITSRVLSTSVFNTEEPRAEFSLAVTVNPYPGRLCAVWIYAVVLIPKYSDRRIR